MVILERSYLKRLVDDSATIKNPEYFTSFAMSMPGERKMKEVIE